MGTESSTMKNMEPPIWIGCKCSTYAALDSFKWRIDFTNYSDRLGGSIKPKYIPVAIKVGFLAWRRAKVGPNPKGGDPQHVGFE